MVPLEVLGQLRRPAHRLPSWRPGIRARLFLLALLTLSPLVGVLIFQDYYHLVAARQRADADATRLAQTKAGDVDQNLLAVETQLAALRAVVSTDLAQIPANEATLTMLLADLPAYVHGIVANMETMLHRLIGENIELSIRLDAVPSSIRADAVQIQQALLNLVINARDAMPNGGTIRVRTGNAREVIGTSAECDLVTLVVTDTGQDMDQQTLARIFEPFFTTKEVGKGSGLGLATVDGIVAQSGGRIRVSSLVDQGTTFTILLPATADLPLGSPAVEPPPASPTGSETVLLVEDEPALRRLSRRVLAQFGYTVLEAPNGEEALSLAEAYHGPINLVLTDVVMPRLSGRDLAERVQSSHPEAKILFMSGYTDDAVVQHGVVTQEVALLRKPFTPYALAARIRDVLDNVG